VGRRQETSSSSTSVGPPVLAVPVGKAPSSRLIQVDHSACSQPKAARAIACTVVFPSAMAAAFAIKMVDERWMDADS
jgi:hypothetical protein